MTARKAAAGLRALAVLSVLGGAWLLIQMLWLAFRLPAGQTVGGLVFAAIFLAAVLSICGMFWSRSGSIREFGDSTFTVIPIVAILFRTAGDVYVALALGVGAGGCIFVWCGGRNPLGLLWGLGGILPYASGEATFAGGVSFLLSLSAVSFLVAILLHFLAEVADAEVARFTPRRAIPKSSRSG